MFKKLRVSVLEPSGTQMGVQPDPFTKKGTQTQREGEILPKRIGELNIKIQIWAFSSGLFITALS